MPYIEQQLRREYNVHPLADCTPMSAGDLQYCIARLINNMLRARTVRYQVMNDVIGALEGAKLEFYRIVVVPYENGKMAENGAVYHVQQGGTHAAD